MNRRKTYKAKVIAAQMDREQRTIRISLALLVTGLLIGQLLILTSP